MKILIIGNGGREHAIAWKVAQSKLADKIYCAPGNAGMEDIAECVPICAMNIEKLADFAKKEAIDLTIVGMDGPLVAGIVDLFEAKDLKIFGPRKNAAIIEGSKVFSKELMRKYKIPTAAYETFETAKDAFAYIKKANYPIVLKADGLAFGKGVFLCNDVFQAEAGIRSIMLEKQFGSAGDLLVVEEFMTGREVSVLAFCDGTNFLTMASAQDHKRANDGDLGLNTGGMGTISPSPFYTKEIDAYCKNHIYKPTVDAMKAEGREFVGILFFGLMLTEIGPKLLEYNARFGDPEAQVILPRMKNDIVEIFEACIDGKLDTIHLEFEENAAACVVLASKGYPEQYETGYLIHGLEQFRNKDGYYVFHAGTKRMDKGIITNGGRVLGVTAIGKDLLEAKKKAYAAAAKIQFDNKYMRRDIGNSIEEVNKISPE